MMITLNNIDDKELMNSLFNDDIIVIEDIQASKLLVNWDGEKFIFRSKKISNEPLNLIDLSLQKYYNPAVNYLNSLDSRVKGLMPKNWNFIFEYFPDEMPGNIKYSIIPKNNLVLTSIVKNGKYFTDIEELTEYARLFDVDVIPVIFQGKLNEKQIEVLKYFLNTSKEDLEYVFGDKNFAFLFYKMLNPPIKNSFLMEDEFQSNIEKLIIRSKNKDISFELLNPLYRRISDDNSTDFTDIYTLILINFLNFCQSVDLEDIKLKGEKKDEAYIYLMCKLFNIYVSEVKQDLLEFDFIIPEFYNKDKFRVNTEMISNKLTKEYLDESDKLEYIFKCIISSFSKKRKKPLGVFTDNTVILFNNFVDSISNYIEKYLNRIHEVELTRAGLIDFSDFVDLAYDKDGNSEVYPDIYDEFEKGDNVGKKKKGGKGKMPMTKTPLK